MNARNSFELIAEGPQPGQRWTRRLAHETPSLLGRDPRADLPVPWDPHISRHHVRIKPGAEWLEVERLSTAVNPLFVAGQAVESCRLKSGDHFVLGSTTFRVLGGRDRLSASDQFPVEEVTFDRQDLQRVRFRDADRRIDVLSRLPEVIWGARTEVELYQRLVNLLLAGVVHAEAAAIVALGPVPARSPDRATDGAGSGDPSTTDAGERHAQVLHWDRRRETAGEFRPSDRLVRDALRKRQHSILHVWDAPHPSPLSPLPASRGVEPPGSDGVRDDYTAMAEVDWAFCTPIPQPVGAPWGLYVAGRWGGRLADVTSAGPQRSDLQADVKFAELVAEIISAVQRLNKLERQQSGLRQFFAPPILSALGEELDTEVLEPRECEVTVLFCDLRGFSQQAEEAAGDLIGLLQRVSRALEVMTEQIRETNGVTGDFQGDAALGFWGWPFPSPEAPLEAGRAALNIQRAFREAARQKNHPLTDFTLGIGIAHGQAVAGKIGTTDQVKVTVFGPVVNLASRLESMTKQLRAPILLDETTADILRARLDPQEGRIRRLARVLPYGMETPLIVSELLPPVSEYPDLTDAHLADYERGVDHFTAGRWDEAYQYLHRMPAGDRAQDFLEMLITQHNRQAPAGWDGIVRLSNK